LNYSVLRTSPFGSPLRSVQIGRTADLVGAQRLSNMARSA